MGFLDHCSFEGEKLQFVGRVMRIHLCQTPTGIGDDSICSIMMSLVEDSPQARPASISMELKRSGEMGLSKNRCHGAQVLQVIKGPLTPVIPHDSSLLLACILTKDQLMHGSSYLCKL